MNYIVLDLEWNQSNSQEREEEKLLFEIIEIGAIKLNSERNMIGEFSQLIKPQVFHEMHRITSKLIHLQMQELEKGIPFQEAMAQFLEWCGKDYIFCTWGPLDLQELQKNMDYYQLTPLTDKPLAFYDVQKLFSIAYEDGKSRRALEVAVDLLNIEKDIPFHRAFSDAYYTAKVLASIKDDSVLKHFSYDLYHVPKSKEDEVFIVFEDYAKYITREFEDKTAALADREVTSTKCYLCHKNLRKKIRWFSPNGKHYYSAAYCDKHGFMKSKIRIKRTDNEKVFVVKTMKFISKEGMDDILEKQARAKEIRKKKRR